MDLGPMVAVRLVTGQRIRVPDCWNNCSTEVFQRIISQWDTDKEIKDRSVLKLFNLMIDMEISPDAEDLDLEAAIWECTRFIYLEPMDFTQLEPPKFLNVAGTIITIPKDLGRMTIGQNIHVRQELQAIKDPNAAMSIITAIYIQPLLDKKPFDFHRAKEIEKSILQIPITQIYPIGFFLLKQLRSYGKGFLPDLNRMIRRKIQSIQLLLNWRKLKDLINSLPLR